MQLSKYAVLAGLLSVIFSVSLFGNHFGYTVNGVPQGAALTHGTSPGLLGIVDFLWDSTVFMFNMTTFQVDGMPAFVATIFLIMGLMAVFIIVNIVRGTEG
jgi:hypothetical protein